YLYCSADHPHLHSFPTRRSSDLRIAPREQFHAHARPSFQNFAAVRTYQAAVRFRRIEEIKNLGFVKARQFAKRPDGGTHLRTLRSEEHTSELQSRSDLVCRLLLE